MKLRRLPRGIPLLLVMAALVVFSNPRPWSLSAGGALVAAGLLVRSWAAGHLMRNEELATSNSALETKIGELEAANNDLDNLLNSTSIATVFLDTHLCIRRFTPAAVKLFSLISSDVGRPIADIAQRFTDPNLLADAAAVLDRPIAPKTEVQGHDGRSYVRQVLP